MTYYETPGVLVDISQYIYYFYNEKRVTEILTSRHHDRDRYLLEIFDELKLELENLPDHLLPFAYGDDRYQSLINLVVYKQPLQSLSLESLVAYLETEDFLLTVYRHWFGEVCEFSGMDDIKKLDATELITRLPVKDDLKYKLVVFFSNLKQYRSDLIQLIRNLYPAVVRFREQHHSLLERSRLDTENTFFYRIVWDKYHLDISDYQYTLALVNCLHFYNDPDKVVIGVRNHLLFNAKPDLLSFTSIYQDPEKVKVIEYIARHGVLRQKDIINGMKIRRDTMNHYLNHLTAEGIIIMENCDHTTFYKLNESYFKNMPSVFQKTIGRLVEDQVK